MANPNDPRKKRRFDTVNEEILDAAVRHGAFLELHARFLSRRQLEFLQREVFPDIVGRLVSKLGRIRRRGGAMDWQAKNWLELVRSTNAQIRSGVTALGGELAKDLTDLAFTEAEWLTRMLRDVTPFQFEYQSPSPRLLRATVSQDPINGKLLKEWFADVEVGTRQRVLQQVRIGIASGDTTEQIVRRIRGTAANGYRDGVWNATRNQVQTVARTATNAIGNAAQRLTHQANRDVVTRVRWDSSMDSRVCPECGGRDGVVLPVQNAIYPPAHPNCLPGDAHVLTRHRINGVSHRVFDGDLVVVKTASGLDFPCTPNHPILTDRGWLPAHALDVGSNVVRLLGGERVSPVDDGHHVDVPTRIHDVAKAFGGSPQVVASPVPVAPEDFHGDGGGSEVAVVWADRLLLDGLDSSVAKHLAQLQFGGGDVARSLLHPLGAPAEVGVVPLHSSGSCMRCGGPLLSLFRRGAVHPGLLLLSPVPHRLSVLSEQGYSRGSSDSDEFCGASYAESLIEKLEQLPDRLVGDIAALHWANASTVKPAEDSVLRDAEMAGDLLGGHSGAIELDAVVRLDSIDFSGHVYNLETRAGWYLGSGGIVSHNCRCVTTPVIGGWEEFGLKSSDLPESTRASMNGQVPESVTFPEWLRGQPREIQERVLGKTKSRLWREGKIEIRDMSDANGRIMSLDEIRRREGLTERDISVSRS